MLAPTLRAEIMLGVIGVLAKNDPKGAKNDSYLFRRSFLELGSDKVFSL